MHQTLNLFQRTSRIFTAYPVLWLPALIADVFRSMLQWLMQPVTRAALIAASPRSAMGGIAGAPSIPVITLIVGLLGFVVTAAGLFLSLYALGIVARSLDPDATSASRRPVLRFHMPSGIRSAWLGVCGLAVLFVLFPTAVLPRLVLPWTARLALRPGTVQIVILAVLLPVIGVLLYLGIGILRPYVLRQQEQPLHRIGTRRPYFVVLAAAFLCSNVAAFGIAYLTRRAVAGPVTLGVMFLILQLLVSAATAFPYAYAMTGMSLSLPSTDTDGTTEA